MPIKKSDLRRSHLRVTQETMDILNAFPSWVDRDIYLYQVGTIKRPRMVYDVVTAESMQGKKEMRDDEFREELKQHICRLEEFMQRMR